MEYEPADRWEWSAHYERYYGARYLMAGAGRRFRPPQGWDGFDDALDFEMDPGRAHDAWVSANRSGRVNADFPTFLTGWFIPSCQHRQLRTAMVLNRNHPARVEQIRQWLRTVEREMDDFRLIWGNN